MPNDEHAILSLEARYFKLLRQVLYTLEFLTVLNVIKTLPSKK